MKTYSHILKIILLLLFFNYISGEVFDPCPANHISISGLGKCIPIEDLLKPGTLNIKTENLLYLASNNEGIIFKDNYKLEIFKLNDTKLQSHNMKKSKLYIPNSCLKQMEERNDIKLQRNKGIVILVYDYNNVNKNNIPDIFFVIRHNSDNSQVKFINSKNFDLSFCNEDQILFEDKIKVVDLRYNIGDNTPIDVDKILYGRKFGIDLFDYDSSFLKDICFEFTSEKGTDVTLESRAEDYYQNITFCDDKESSHYLAYNLSSDKTEFTYRCSFGFYKDAADRTTYLDKIDHELKSLVSVSNIKIIRCYRNFLNLKDIIRNYGGMICICVLLIQIICFLIFCFRGIKPLEDRMEDLFILGKVALRRLGVRISIFDNNDSSDKIDKKPKQLFNLWGKIKLILIRKKQEREENTKLGLKIKGRNPPKKDKRRKSKSSINIKDKKENRENKENKENVEIISIKQNKENVEIKSIKKNKEMIII